MAKEKKELNKFEETRLLSARAYEVSKGGKPQIKTKKGEVLLSKDYVEVAKKELAEDKIELEIYK